MFLSRTVICLVVLLGISVFPIRAVAAGRSMTISSPDTTLGQDAEMRITASVSGFTDGETVYVKGAFYKDGSTNYFGYTGSGVDWVRNSATNVSQLKTVIGVWDGTIRVKCDYGDSGYDGEGEYLMKVRYYYGDTGSGWSENTIPVFIHAPDPTQTPIPTPTVSVRPTQEPSRTPTPSVTASPTPPVPTYIPTVTAKPTGFPLTDRSGSFDILVDEGINTGTPAAEILGSADATEDLGNVREIRPWVFGLLFAGIGTAILSFALALRKSNLWKNQKTHLVQ